MNTVSNTASLIAVMDDGFAPEWLLFWGHTPVKDGSLTKTCFSQWWAGHPFVVNDTTYHTAEHFMMAEKARLFGDEKTRAKIPATTDPAAGKKLGREVRGFNEETWLAARWDIVVRGNTAKFFQHAGLNGFLLRTGDRVLVEASPVDRIWGIGLATTHADAGNPRKWQGLNLLGFELMEVRRNLAKANASAS